MRIDCDLHVIEPPDLWSDIDLIGDGWSGLKFRRGGSLVPPEYITYPDPYQYRDGIMQKYRDGFENSWDRDSTLRAMDRMRVDQALLMPTRGLFVVTIGEEYGFLMRACRIYNEWIDKFTAPVSDRLLPVHLWDLISPVSDRAVAVVIRPQAFQYVEAFPDVPLVLHEGTTPTDPCIGFGRTSNRLEAHSISHPFEAMWSVLRLTMGGVLDRNPKLKVLICEAGSWWFDGWLRHLDDEASGVNGYANYRQPHLPSHYASRIFITASPGSVTEQSVFGSDYPHGDSSYPHFPFYDEAYRFMSANAQRFLHDTP